MSPKKKRELLNALEDDKVKDSKQELNIEEKKDQGFKGKKNNV